MDKYKAIPQGYMTVGEIAKKMGVTVRTLQYYDKEGILTPSSESEGGRRLYTNKDIVKLHQIQSMKYLGFSLEDIKTRLPAINTPEEVSAVLSKQAADIREKIKALKEVQQSIEKLNAEVVQMETVNWERYADIIVLLQAKNDAYWAMKHLSDNALAQIRKRYDNDSGIQMNESYTKMVKKAIKTQQSGHPPESEQGQALAKEWWDFVMEFTQGDMSLLSELYKMGNSIDYSEWSDKLSFDKGYLEKALSVYFMKTGHNPFEHDSSDIPVSKNYMQLLKKAAETQQSGHTPDSEQGQAFAKEWWDFVMEFTKGDAGLLAELQKQSDGISESEWRKRFSFDKGFLEKALEVYLANSGYIPS